MDTNGHIFKSMTWIHYSYEILRIHGLSEMHPILACWTRLLTKMFVITTYVVKLVRPILCADS